MTAVILRTYSFSIEPEMILGAWLGTRCLTRPRRAIKNLPPFNERDRLPRESAEVNFEGTESKAD